MVYDSSPADEILGAYPELMRQWHNEALECGPNNGGGNAVDFARLHDPVYLNEIVRQHRLVLQGCDPVDPGRLAEIDQIVSQHPGFKARRAKTLADPFWRALVKPRQIAEQYDVDYLRSAIEPWINPPDPFSPDELRFQAFVDAISAGAEVTLVEIATGEETARFETRVTKHRSARSN